MSVNSDGCPWPQPLDHRDMEWPAEEQRVLVPFREGTNRTEPSLLGGSIAFGTDGKLYLLHVVEGDATTDPGTIRNDAEAKLAVKQAFQIPVVQRREVFSSDCLGSFVETHAITSVLVDSEERGFFAQGDDETAELDCHTLVGTRMGNFESPETVLVPVDRGPHSGIATRVAEAVATAYDSRIELFHVAPENATAQQREDATKLLDAYSYRIDDAIEVTYHVAHGTEPAQSIIDQSERHDLTILGAPEKGEIRRFLFGSTADSVVENGGTKPILVAHRNGTESLLSRWF